MLPDVLVTQLKTTCVSAHTTARGDVHASDPERPRRADRQPCVKATRVPETGFAFALGVIAPDCQYSSRGPVISVALFEWASSMDRAAVAVTRLALIVVLVWIGGLKAAKYEADSIVPFIANSPLMRFFYADRRHYRTHMNPEGSLVPANRAWH